MNVYMLLCLAAVAVVGLIEWVKNFVEKFLTVPGWVWSVVVLLASIGCGFLAVYGADVTAHNPLMAVLLGLAILALAQIGYDGLKTAITKRAEKALFNEYVMTRLRTAEGIDLDEVAARFGSQQAARVVLKDNKLTATVRQADGSIKTEVKYVPPEGKAEVVQPEGGAAEIAVKRAGLTFRPAVQGLVGKELKAGLGVRLAYFDRYGAGVGLDTDLDGYLFVDRRLDDLTGLLKNTSAGVYGARGKVGLMIGVYF